ncbi:glutathione peroxidase [Formosimonas limnophila]|uniref:Glutathione peroxidase n=1 Tax=Formosimonas limnophila TaxID=1384487 RepID=A0A8J3CF72_9BURK|nr:glutathione peroxidase [Formosimonas limnophila]GHA64523.1 glutathione peroxidase [Formosimonas limnophila]
MPKITDFTVKNLIDEPESLSQYEGRVVLFVNTASACRFTPQYAQLQKLYEQYAERGLSVLAFPCNQFGRQESGSSDEIGAFCDKNFQVTFPVMGKVSVNGKQADPVWQWLKSQAPGVLGTQSIKWNFTKFLIGRDGRTVKRYAPLTEPVKMVADIKQLLVQSIQS